MKVNELIELLQTCDPEAEVRLGTQASYLFQNTVAGVVDGDAILNYVGAEYPDETVDFDGAPSGLLNDFNGPVDTATVFILEGD